MENLIFWKYWSRWI